MAGASPGKIDIARTDSLRYDGGTCHGDGIETFEEYPEHSNRNPDTGDDLRTEPGKKQDVGEDNAGYDEELDTCRPRDSDYSGT